MRFPHPVAIACRTCGHPTVEAETSTGFVRVHCGTWRWQCDTPVDAGVLSTRELSTRHRSTGATELTPTARAPLDPGDCLAA
jgi:hypothetical protein